MAPPLKHEGLTEQQLKFVQRFLVHSDQKLAATEAGYSGDAAAVGYQLVRHPQIAAVIYAELTVKLKVEGATLGYRVLQEIARDDTAPKGVRADCAKALLDRAGFPAQRAREAPKQGAGSLADMSLDDLRELVAKLEREAGDKARDITPASDNSANADSLSPQSIELLS